MNCSARPTYRISGDGRSIRFIPCGLVSYNLSDVKHRYCARCHRFLDDLEEQEQAYADR